MLKWLKLLIILVSAIIGLFGLLLLLATLTDYRPEKPEIAETKGNAPGFSLNDSVFTFLSWNIGYFGLGKDCDFFYDGGRMTRPSEAEYRRYSGEALEYLRKAGKSDFYFFQEVDIKSRRSYFDNQVNRLREIFPGMESSSALNYLVSYVPVPIRDPMGKVKSCLVSFSSFHTGENTRYAFPGSYDWPVRMFMLDRCYLLSRIDLPGGMQLVLINTHNEAFDDGSQRNREIDALKEMMLKEYEKGNYVITGGDWNLNPVGELTGVFSTGDIWKPIKPAIEADFFPEGWKWAFDPEIPTNRDVDQVYRRGVTPTTIIDFFVVSPNIIVENVQTEDLGFEWCDHQPVIMTFRLGL